jgi:hypothetical protein
MRECDVWFRLETDARVCEFVVDRLCGQRGEQSTF